jgi:hypothetical protein
MRGVDVIPRRHTRHALDAPEKGFGLLVQPGFKADLRRTKARLGFVRGVGDDPLVRSKRTGDVPAHHQGILIGELPLVWRPVSTRLNE